MIFYMLLTASNLFTTPEQLNSGTWSISTDLEYSIEAIRFLNEILTWDRNLRPFPDKLPHHIYFQCDIDRLVTVKKVAPTLAQISLPCVKPGWLEFSIKNSSNFDDLYRFFTG